MIPTASTACEGPARSARLVLADGLVFEGEGFGAIDTLVGEVVFNTALTGYQEVISDPSYAEQIICFSTPEIGNTGINDEDDEAPAPRARGVIVRNLERVPSSWRAQGDLDTWLAGHGVVGLCGIDTRRLVRHLRSAGAQMGAIDSTGEAIALLRARAEAAPGMAGRDLVTTLSRAEALTLPPTIAPGGEPKAAPVTRVVVVDFGAKASIVAQLRARGAQVTLVPSRITAEAILALRTDGVLLSNGPGDPAALSDPVALVQALLGKVPIFGICLGAQILGLALGARTHKLRFGHHGANHPVLDLETGKVEVTSQNHGFAIDEASLPDGVQVTHRSLNDETVEGIAAPEQRAFAVQYHPEASPGPHDARHLFERFLSRLGD